MRNASDERRIVWVSELEMLGEHRQLAIHCARLDLLQPISDVLLHLSGVSFAALILPSFGPMTDVTFNPAI